MVDRRSPYQSIAYNDLAIEPRRRGRSGRDCIQNNTQKTWFLKRLPDGLPMGGCYWGMALERVTQAKVHAKQRELFGRRFPTDSLQHFWRLRR